MARQKMEHMTAYNNGYVPPRGSAGAAAYGEHSHKHNPLKVPEKGSALRNYSGEYGSNSDRNKSMMLKEERSKQESLRGYAC